MIIVFLLSLFEFVCLSSSSSHLCLSWHVIWHFSPEHGLSASSGSWIFPIIAGLYLLHTSQFFLVALYLAWSYLRNQAKLKINDAWFKGDGNGGVTLILQVNFKIPFDFGAAEPLACPSSYRRRSKMSFH